MWSIQEIQKFELLQENIYEYIETPIGVSPWTLLESVLQAA
jgi:hypothetical protein